MGKMTDSFGRTPADVRVWPADPAARQVLKAYLEALPRDSIDVPQSLGADRLDFTGADLSGLDLTGAWLNEAILSGVRLAGAALWGSWLIAATLRGTDLSGCMLRKAQGRKCDARDAILRGANLDRAEFEDADFRGADLSGATFGRAWMPGVDLRGAKLSECMFGGEPGGTALLEARLAGCRLAGARGRVKGPIDVGSDIPHLIDGGELQEWFASQGAPLIEVVTPRP